VKIMVNENHFQFDRKNLFNFWKTICCTGQISTNLVGIWKFF